ncbi:sigma-54 interaction domain-containing protein [Effusibacillus lacus]|nr:sigma 54-interacting transcriptional regulator [Effusibacillus lacus]
MLHAILGSIDEGIHAVNRDGITVFYNEVAGKLDGLVPEEVIGKHVLDVFPSLGPDTSTLLQVLATGKPVDHVKQTYTNVHGKAVHTVNSTMPIFSRGQLIGALEVAKDLTQVKELAEKLIDLQASLISQRKAKPRQKLEARYTFDDIITCNPRMIELKELAARASSTDSSVLVCGETGTGKELFVQSIHNFSLRRNRPFIAQNCAAMPASLLEGLLFGTVKGSFTGAENRPGLFELADGGTLFLDEINSMPLELQVKLLRVLQEGYVRRIGDTKVTPVNVRVLAATNSDPLEAIQKGLLRADLYYRLNVVSLHLPRLAERKEDIRLLTRHFLELYNERFHKRVDRLTPEVERCFQLYHWPGNVRELQHAIESAMNLVREDTIGIELIPPQIAQEAGVQRKHAAGSDGSGNSTAKGLGVLEEFEASGLSLREYLDRVERTIIERWLERTKGNVVQAAKRLGMPRQTLQYRVGRGRNKE